MGVFVLPVVVRKEHNKVSRVETPDAPEANPINALNDLVFLDELRDSLLEIADTNLDLSFFTKPNDSSYGNTGNENLSFSPESVLTCINKIRTAFKERESEFVRPVSYDGVVNPNGGMIRQAFIIIEEGKFLRKKKTQRWGDVSAFGDRVSFQWYDDENKKWGDTIDLSKSQPNLYELTYDNENKVIGNKLDYTVISSRFFDLIKPELDNIEALAIYAKAKGFELQITHG